MSGSKAARVLVVGAGPVGLTLALLLDRAGVDVVIVDRAAAPVSQSRAIWVHSRTLEVWDTIGMTPLAAAEGRQVTGIQMRVSGEARATLPYDGAGLSAHPHGLMLEQSRTQALLLHLIASTKIQFSWNTALTEITQDEAGCRAALERDDGGATVMDAAFVVGADGGSSTVRKLLGVSLEGGTYDTSFFLADVHADTKLDPSMSYLNFHRRSTVAVLPLPGDRHFRLIGNLIEQSGEPGNAGYGRELEPERIRRLVTANALPVTLTDIGWSSTYRSHHRVADTFRVGRVLLVGDAGHLHSPAGGLGMNTGIADAANLAWKIAAVLQDAPTQLLDTYTQERREVALNVVNTSDRLFTLQADTRARYAFARRHILPRLARRLTLFPFGKRLAFRVLSGTAVRYPLPVGRKPEKQGLLRAGALLPFTGNPAIDTHDAITHGQHALLLINPTPHGREHATRLATERRWPVIAITDSATATHLTGHRRPLTAWIRPDRYIGWLGTDHADLARILDTTLGTPHPRPAPTGHTPSTR